MAIENLEGPDGRPFKSEVGFVMDYYQVLYPVMGVPDPVEFLKELENANTSKAKRLFVLFGDRFNNDLYFTLYDRFNINPTNGIIPRLSSLKDVAKEKVGDQSADKLLNVWLSLNEAREPSKAGFIAMRNIALSTITFKSFYTFFDTPWATARCIS